MVENLIFEIDDAVAILTINDAPYNRMSLDFMDSLEEMVIKIEKDDSIRAVVLTANGLDNFSVGMNLKQFSEGVEKKGSSDALFDQRLKVIAAIETMQKPWIVTMFGYCLGGGLEVPLGCHFRLAADEGAQIGLPELDLGAVPAWGGSARLAKCVGENQAMDMILRSKKISGKKALEIGLVHEIWPIKELKGAALSLAHELAAQPAQAVKSMMKVLVNSNDRELEELLVEERKAVKDNANTKDSKEGMLSFLEKRKPIFNK
ncbi:MAG: enoyl-CoA hydratase/isomerase family protein [Gammaproteobacteria bacterium]|nr:MAG: enoyl-CoA hydratase/isomerase family protein [Gammaproteobacteria bacterium]